jgi:hypothetical protein
MHPRRVLSVLCGENYRQKTAKDAKERAETKPDFMQDFFYEEIVRNMKFFLQCQ